MMIRTNMNTLETSQGQIEQTTDVEVHPVRRAGLVEVTIPRQGRLHVHKTVFYKYVG